MISGCGIFAAAPFYFIAIPLLYLQDFDYLYRGIAADFSLSRWHK